MPSPSPKSPVTPAPVQVHTSVNTRIIAIAVGFLALGLAAYGFGFIPTTDLQETTPQQQEEVADPQDTTVAVADCHSTCTIQYRQCVAFATLEKCDGELARCEGTCEAPSAPEPVPSLPETAVETTTPASACTFTVEHTESIGQSPLRLRTIVPNGNWQVLNRYLLNAGQGDVTIRQMGLTTGGSFNHFLELGLMRDGALVARIPATGVDRVIDLPFLGEFRIAAGQRAQVDLVARLAPVVDSRAGDGVMTPFLHSGDRVDLSIGSGNAIGMWNRGYENNYNIEAECAPSMTRVYAAGSSERVSFIARKSQLVLTQQPLSTTTLTSGRQNVYRFQASVIGAGSVAMKKMAWEYSHLASSGTYLGDLRLYEGNTEVPADAYRITDQFGRDLRSLPLSPASQNGKLILTFVQEEMVNRAGQVYALSAQSRNPGVGDLFQLKPVPEGQTGIATGYLTAEGPRGSFNGLAGPTIDESEPADGVPDAGAHVIWSDLSETSHSARAGQDGGSRDWIAGTTDDELGQQTVSR